MTVSDIAKHEWSDKDLSFWDAGGESISVEHGCYHFIDFNKQDAIAIAKHFGIIDKAYYAGKRDGKKCGYYLTEDDLK